MVTVPASSTVPVSPAWSTTASLQYFLNNTSLGFPYAALDHFYKDFYITYLPSQHFVPGFNIFGLRIGPTVANELQITLRVQNLFDERSATYFSPGSDGAVLPDVCPDVYWITRPHTVSLSIQKNF